MTLTDCILGMTYELELVDGWTAQGTYVQPMADAYSAMWGFVSTDERASLGGRFAVRPSDVLAVRAVRTVAARAKGETA